MNRIIAIHLFYTSVLAFLVTALLYAIWFLTKPEGNPQHQTLLLLCIANLLYTSLMMISSLPAFLLSNVRVYTNQGKRLLVYFGGPVFFLFFYAFFIVYNVADLIGFLIPAISFIGLHTFFYNRLMKNFFA